MTTTRHAALQATCRHSWRDAHQHPARLPQLPARSEKHALARSALAAPAAASTIPMLLPGQPGGRSCRRGTHGRSYRPIHAGQSAPSSLRNQLRQGIGLP
jgi:hypothetical protein